MIFTEIMCIQLFTSEILNINGTDVEEVTRLESPRYNSCRLFI